MHLLLDPLGATFNATATLGTFVAFVGTASSNQERRMLDPTNAADVWIRSTSAKVTSVASRVCRPLRVDGTTATTMNKIAVTNVATSSRRLPKRKRVVGYRVPTEVASV